MEPRTGIYQEQRTLDAGPPEPALTGPVVTAVDETSAPGFVTLHGTGTPLTFADIYFASGALAGTAFVAADGAWTLAVSRTTLAQEV